MALVDICGYVSASRYANITAWSSLTAFSAGALCRQSAPTLGNQRVFVALNGGTTGATEPVWVLTRGAKAPSDNGIIWMECTGLAGVCGDLTSTPTWAACKAGAGGTATLGQLIQRNNGASLQICSTSGTFGASEPSFSDTAGTTTQETSATAVWTSLGAPSNYGLWAACAFDLVAVPGLAAGWTVYVADDHAVSSFAAHWLYTFPGTQQAPNYVYSIDHTITAFPPTAADRNPGAVEGPTSGASYCQLNGSFYMEGFTLNGSPTSSTTGYMYLAATGSPKQYYKNCTFALRNNSTVYLYVGLREGSILAEITFDNCTVSFGSSATQLIYVTSKFTWKNSPSALSWTTMPTTLFSGYSAGSPFQILLEGVDLGNYTGNILAQTGVIGTFVLKDCKLHASATLHTGNASYSVACVGLDLIRSDSGDTNYKIVRTRYEGMLTTETTVVRTGGASDGTTAVAWKVVTNANVQFYSPFECPPIAIWNDTVGVSITVTLYGIWGNAALPTNADLWLDVSYIADPSYPLASVASGASQEFCYNDGVACVPAGAVHDADGSTWGGSTTPFAMSMTIVPQAKGYIYITPQIAKRSSTFYIDPQPVLS